MFEYTKDTSKWLSEIESYVNNGYELEFFLGNVIVDNRKDHILEQYLKENENSRDKSIHFKGLNNLKQIVDIAKYYYGNNIVGAYYKDRNYYNEISHNIDKYEGCLSFRANFSIMRMTSGGGSGVFRITIALSNKSKLREMANEYREPYKSIGLKFIDEEFDPNKEKLKEAMYGMHNGYGEDSSVYHILNKVWFREDRDIYSPESAHGYDSLLSEAMNETLELIKKEMQNVGYLMDDFTFDLGRSSLKITNIYLDMYDGYRLCSRTEVWTENIK